MSIELASTELLAHRQRRQIRPGSHDANKRVPLRVEAINYVMKRASIHAAVMAQAQGGGRPSILRPPRVRPRPQG